MRMKYKYSVEHHYNTEGGMGCEVYADDLESFEAAEKALDEACREDGIEGRWFGQPVFKHWVIIVAPLEYKEYEGEG